MEIEAGQKRTASPCKNRQSGISTAFGKAGAVVDDVATYDTVYEKQSVIDEAAQFKKGNIDCVAFTSASTVKGFVESVSGDVDFTKVCAACIGKQTKVGTDAYGMKTYMADRATIDSLVDLVIKLKG